MKKLTVVHDRVIKNGLPHNRGGITYVFDKEQEVKYDVDGHFCILNMGLAICHCDDNFNRSIGRFIATGRVKEVVFEFILQDGIKKKYAAVIGDYEFVASIENDKLKFIGSKRLRDGELTLSQYNKAKVESI